MLLRYKLVYAKRFKDQWSFFFVWLELHKSCVCVRYTLIAFNWILCLHKSYNVLSYNKAGIWKQSIFFIDSTSNSSKTNVFPQKFNLLLLPHLAQSTFYCFHFQLLKREFATNFLHHAASTKSTFLFCFQNHVIKL